MMTVCRLRLNECIYTCVYIYVSSMYVPDATLYTLHWVFQVNQTNYIVRTYILQCYFVIVHMSKNQPTNKLPYSAYNSKMVFI